MISCSTCGGTLLQKLVLKKIKSRNFKIPGFVCEKCKKIHFTPEIIQKIENLRDILNRSYPV